MSELVKIDFKDEFDVDTHLISFVGGKTVCGIEYLANDNVKEITYITGSIKKVDCPYCSQLIKQIKNAR